MPPKELPDEPAKFMLKVRTMSGNHVELEASASWRIKDLKRALLSKKDGEGPIGVQLLKDNSLLLLANDQTLESAGLLQPEADVMVIFSILRLGSKIRTMGRKLGSNGRP